MAVIKTLDSISIVAKQRVMTAPEIHDLIDLIIKDATTTLQSVDDQ